MRLLRRPLGGSPLVRDYLSGTAAAASLYRGSPFELATYRDKAKDLERTTGPGAIARVVPMIKPVGPAADEALRAVARDHGYFVTTGQQPGLFGGPLYSLYKALTAVRLAEVLAAELDRPVMPLFWVASEDHDWEEANHTHVVDASNELHRIGIGPGPVRAGRPLGRVRVGDGIHDAVGQLAGHFPRNDFHTRYIDLVRRTFHPSATMASAFSGLMTELLRDTPVGLVDAADPALKQASRPLLLAEAEDPADSEAAVSRSCDDLTQRGYHHQVPYIAGATNLFLDSVDGRDRVQHGAGGFELRRTGRTISREDMLALIDDAPQRVSPNVLLRPVVESFVFPTLAYVGGPGELAYFGQLGRLFRRHGVGMPVVVPRGSLLVLEKKVVRAIEKHGLEIDELREGNALLSRFARDQVPEGVSGAVAAWRGAVESFATELTGTVKGIDPVLEGAVTKARNSGLAALGALEKKIVRAVKRSSEVTWNQIAKAQVNLWPAGKPQDRVLGPLQYLMRYGEEFVSMALCEIRVELHSGKS